MNAAYLSAAVLALTLGAISTANALEAPASRSISEIRLLPPVAQPMSMPTSNLQTDMDRALRVIRERHPEVISRPLSSGRYVVSVLLHPDGRVERSDVRQADASDMGAMLAMRSQMSPDATRVSSTVLPQGRPLSDGTILNSGVVVQIGILPPNYDASRSVSRVHKIVRERHANLLLPASGEVLNRLTVFMNENGQIEREHVELIRFDSLRRAPLEDDKFAERMTERFSRPLGVDAQKIGVVGFTYVEEGSPRVMVLPDGSTRPDAGERRTLLVQYAWPRRPGEQGPSMPMAAPAQQQPQTFDTAAALALAEYHFRDAFGGRESSAGTPTIVLNWKGEVLRVGRVQYRSGEIHETSLQRQLVPGIKLERLVSPTLRNSDGASAVITFAWVTEPTR
jgi:hypothetical protein